MSEMVGKVLGEFEVIRELGRGGMGIVYEARQIPLNRRVALKVIGPGIGLTPRAVLRFRREAESAAKLHHTNIVPVYATGEADGYHFYAMELIDGPSLDRVISDLRDQHVSDFKPTETPSPELAVTGPYLGTPTPTGAAVTSGLSSGTTYFDTVARMIADVADALDHAHRNGVIHRDIKPGNLLLGSDGRLSVNDFGLARALEEPGMTTTGEFVGTPAYMAPEQIASGRIPVDHRCDIYSLGATLYELLALRPPFVAERRDQLLALVVQKDPTAPRRANPKVPRDLDTICLKCLEKDPDRRYQSGKELADDLLRYVNRFAILARRAGPLTRAKKWVRRNPALSGAGFVTLLALAAAGAFAWRAHEAEQRRIAEKRKQDEETLASARRAAIEKALTYALANQFDRAEAALIEADALGADVPERLFVRGVISHFRGRGQEAIQALTACCNERPDWVSPRALLALAYNASEDWDAYIHHGRIALELTPRSAEDYLFRGFALSIVNPRRGMEHVERAASITPSAFATLIRAELQAQLADYTGKVTEADEASRALQRLGIDYPDLRDAPTVRAQRLWACCVHANNLRRSGKADQAKALLKEAEPLEAALREQPPHPLSELVLSQYVMLTESEDRWKCHLATVEKRGPGGYMSGSYVALRFVQKQSDKALAHFDQHAHAADAHSGFIKIILMYDTGHDRKALYNEAQRLLGVRRNPEARLMIVVALYWVGLREEARTEAKKVLGQKRELFGEDVTAKLFEVMGQCLAGEKAEAELLAIADESNWSALAYHVLTVLALDRHDRKKARYYSTEFLKRSPLSYYHMVWYTGLHKRFQQDDTWPPWSLRVTPSHTPKP